MLVTRNIPSYDDQVRQLKAFVGAREDSIVTTTFTNKRICAYLDNHVLDKEIERFLTKLIQADDIEDFKHDECYEGRFNTWAEYNSQMQRDLDAAAHRHGVRA